MPRFPAVALLLLGCGARTELGLDDPSGSSSSTGGTSPAGGSGGRDDGGNDLGGSSAGGLGGAPECQALVWVGDPVHLSANVANAIESPALVATGDGDYALVFDGINDAFGHAVASIPLHVPFAAWPPITGEPAISFLTQAFFAPYETVPALYGFAAVDTDGSLVFGQALPGGEGAILKFSLHTQTVHAARQSTSGVLFAVHGGQDFLSAAGVYAGSNIVPFTTLGCAQNARAALVPASGDDFLIASAVDQPFDQCLDPDLPGPAVVLQTQRADATGVLENLSFLNMPAPITELAFEPHPGGGGWLGVQVDGSSSYEIRRVSANGLLDNAVAVKVSDLGAARHAIAARGPDPTSTSFALVQLVSTDVHDLSLSVFNGQSFITAPPHPAILAPVDRPALAVAPDGRSFLVAVMEPLDSSSITLLRAECVGGL